MSNKNFLNIPNKESSVLRSDQSPIPEEIDRIKIENGHLLYKGKAITSGHGRLKESSIPEEVNSKSIFDMIISEIAKNTFYLGKPDGDWDWRQVEKLIVEDFKEIVELDGDIYNPTQENSCITVNNKQLDFGIISFRNILYGYIHDKGIHYMPIVFDAFNKNIHHDPLLEGQKDDKIYIPYFNDNNGEEAVVCSFRPGTGFEVMFSLLRLTKDFFHIFKEEIKSINNDDLYKLRLIFIASYLETLKEAFDETSDMELYDIIFKELTRYGNVLSEVYPNAKPFDAHITNTKTK